MDIRLATYLRLNKEKSVWDHHRPNTNCWIIVVLSLPFPSFNIRKSVLKVLFSSLNSRWSEQQLPVSLSLHHNFWESPLSHALPATVQVDLDK